MARHSSSRRWLREHHGDAFVRRARAEGYRSRAAFKLADIDARDRLLTPGASVVDLGAAPGGWSQLAAERVGPGGRVVALDILPMEPLAGVDFIQGDFREQAVLDALLERLGGTRPALVMSDMAPNISGIGAVDQPRSMHLAELALDLARQVLAPEGSLLVKIFQGEGFDALRAEMRSAFAAVAVRKPQASRARSREVYFLGRGFRD